MHALAPQKIHQSILQTVKSIKMVRSALFIPTFIPQLLSEWLPWARHCAKRAYEGRHKRKQEPHMQRP